MATVYPVKDPKQIVDIDNYIKRYFTEIYTDIWNFGLQVSLRISDILKIEFDHIINGVVRFKSQKTGKVGDIKLNKKAMTIVRRRTKSGDKYLFQSKSNRTGTAIKPISPQKVGEAIREAGRFHGLILGTHSMRKSWGYHVYKKTNDLGLVQKALQHSTSRETLKYIGIEQEQLDEIYSTFEL